LSMKHYCYTDYRSGHVDDFRQSFIIDVMDGLFTLNTGENNYDASFSVFNFVRFIILMSIFTYLFIALFLCMV